ncbi:LIM domain only protein 7-like isoform X2 [Hypomesus transpacificus]|uniref:LIM domain only protein 7-like isoform X2 n=1 Tax=Hypomesus transpacificus TaxID=137520 RepID=UPI001F08632E|nr:LIM domain only protein 7-like isoform X2 [Hypomesus transpacificus]
MTSSVKRSIKTEPKKAGPSQAIVDNHKRRTNLLQDNSWIRRESDEDHCVYPSTNKEIPSYIKSPNRSNSHVTERNQSCPSSPGSSVNDLAKRFGGGQEVISKESPTLTTKNKTVSFGKIITSELGKEDKSNWQNTFLPTTKVSAEPSSNISSFSARVFHSSRLPHNNPTTVIHHKASPITLTGKEVVDTYGSLVHPTSNGTTESTIQTKTNNPSNLECVAEKGLCSYCCEPFPEAGARIILEDLQICSHTTCFKCEVCYCPLGDLEEGCSMWVLREKVLCESCFNTTRDKWLL